ncbi:hypothetical protein ACFQAT_28495 [Undibacterium arcticum]|uniref:hypothetical protein n=1 Tax=Undibacterium arcticum TaxID=1762892 RepID=UPI00361C408A
MKLITQFAVVLAFQSLPTLAEQPDFAKAVLSVGRQTEYMVSSVLRSNSDGIVIKLIQGIRVANSVDEAVGGFTRDALTQYPGYSVIDALGSAVITRHASCGQSI